MMARHIVLMVFLLSWALIVSPETRSEESVQGAWRLSMYDLDYRESPDRDPPPGILIFSQNHYSAILPYEDEGMPKYAERWSPTDQERLQRFQELIFNAGTYEIGETQIKMQPMVAKDPDLINGYVIFDYEWSGEKLILTWVDEYSFDGVQHPLIQKVGGQEHMTFLRLPDS